MAELEFVGASAVGEGHDLVTETDAEEGCFPDELLDVGNDVGQGGGIAGAVADEDGVRVVAEDFFRGGLGRDYGYVHLLLGESGEDVAFDAEVVGNDFKAFVVAGGYVFVADSEGFFEVVQLLRNFVFVRLGDGDVVDEVCAVDAGDSFCGGYEFINVFAGGGNDGSHGAFVSQVKDEGAGVDSLYARDVVFCHVISQVDLAAPVAGGTAEFLYDEGGNLGIGRFVVQFVDAVVSDLGVGHYDHLAQVGGVGKNFLVTGHAGIKNDFGCHLCGGTKGTSVEDCAVFKYERRGYLVVYGHLENCFHHWRNLVFGKQIFRVAFGGVGGGAGWIMKRLHAIVNGRVQGVGYRNFVWKNVRDTGVVGYVRNLPDRTVEVVVEGKEEDLEGVMRVLRKGPLLARVDDVAMEYLEASGEFLDFSVRY